jgi:uncharacterized protein
MPPSEQRSVIDMVGSSGIEVRETHISVLLIVGDRVYKFRKPVHFGFVDFTRRESREEDCRREVTLNRRLAPDVYLGVADVVMDGIPVDHMVVMRALPEARQLAALVEGGSDVGAALEATAEALASFHAKADRSALISEAGTPAAVRARWMDNFDEMRPYVGKILDPQIEREIHSLAERWLDCHAGLLEDRMAAGFVCDGHGDLQASDIFCLESGVRILDCLEFSDALRFDDVCGDVGFLTMDLERLGHPEAAHEFVQAYEGCSGCRLPPTLLHFHVALRAYIRAKVECIRSEQGTETAADSARGLHGLARRHLFRARRAVVLVGGLPGSGKTTLARALGSELGWPVIGSDAVRPHVAVGPGRYAPQAIASVYAQLFRQARDHLRHGSSVVLDASWISADERAQAAQMANQMQAELVELQCTCAREIASERIRRRVERGDGDSEASVSVRTMMEAAMDPWTTGTVIDTTGSGADAVRQALAALATT